MFICNSFCQNQFSLSKMFADPLFIRLWATQAVWVSKVGQIRWKAVRFAEQRPNAVRIRKIVYNQ